jgi:hypothetical protein
MRQATLSGDAGEAWLRQQETMFSPWTWPSHGRQSPAASARQYTTAAAEVALRCGHHACRRQALAPCTICIVFLVEMKNGQCMWFWTRWPSII